MFFWDICNILNNIVLYQNPRRIWDFPFEYSILKYQVEKRGWAKSRLEHVGKQDKDALLSCIASQAGGQVLFPFLFKPVLDLLGSKVNDQEGVLPRGSGKGSFYEKVKIGKKNHPE